MLVIGLGIVVFGKCCGCDAEAEWMGAISASVLCSYIGERTATVAGVSQLCELSLGRRLC